MSAAQVAQKLLGSPANAIKLDTRAVEKGRVNRGCFVHTAENTDGQRVVFFEKRTSLDREINFCSKLAEPYLSDREPILPRIHEVRQHKRYASIYMEHIPSVGQDFPRSTTEAYALAMAISRIAKVDSATIPRASNAISTTLLERFEEIVTKENMLDLSDLQNRLTFADCIKSTADLKAELVSRVPLIANHNDIYIPNMGSVVIGRHPSFCFVDWGKYSLNFAGSDFHHFQFEAILHEADVSFINLAYEIYVSSMRDLGHGFSVGDVQLAATYYSLQRSMSRVLNRPSSRWVEITLALFASTRALAQRSSRPVVQVTTDWGKQESMSMVNELRSEAEAAVAAKDWNKAAQLWQAVIDERQNDVVAHARLARALRQIGDYRRAEKTLTAGEAIQPDNERLQAERAALSKKLEKTNAKAPGNVYHGNTAVTYHERRKDSTRWKAEDKAVRTLLETLPEGISVIDLPFGTGRFTEFYAARQVKITGVDISADMLNAARQIYGEALQDATLEVGDATALKYPDDHFDLAVSVRFLQNIIPYGLVKLALREMARVTRSWAILEFEIRKPDAVDAGPLGEDEPLRGLLNQNQIGDMLEDAGFRLSRTIPVYNNGPSDYCILLCDVTSTTR